MEAAELYLIFLGSCVNYNCGVSVSHHFEGHVHETHGHKTTTSSGHGEEEHKGISLNVVVAEANCS